jgi:restriction endonuclease Mrr
MTEIVRFANRLSMRKGKHHMHIALAPFRLKPGVSENVLLSTSDDFEERFVQKQDGVLKRILVKSTDGGYADIVYFEDLAAIDRVVQAEQNSEICAAFFSIMDDDGSHRVYEVLKTYE